MVAIGSVITVVILSLPFSLFRFSFLRAERERERERESRPERGSTASAKTTLGDLRLFFILLI
jgi:hypothetical protein